MGKSAETIAWYKENGICLHCGQRPAKRGCQKCSECLANKNDASKIWYHNLSADDRKKLSERNSASSRKKENRRIEQGLCYRCGKRPPVVATKYGQCAICRAKSKEYTRRRRIKSGNIPRDERISGYNCYRCAKPITSGKYCPECYEIVSASISYARRFLTGRNGWHAFEFNFGKETRHEKP